MRTSPRLLLVAVLAFAALAGSTTAAEPPGNETTFTVRQAAQHALASNPELAAVRQQRGLSAAGVVLARAHPFNPILSATPRGAMAPRSAGISHFTIDTGITLEMEVFGQKKHRMAAAQANLSRTEWEIAAAELDVACRTVRAFNTVIYRQEKLKLQQQNLRLALQAVLDLQEFWKKKKEKQPAGEAVFIQFEVQEAKAQQVFANGPLVSARNELTKALGVTRPVEAMGDLEITYRKVPEDQFIAQALAMRPEVRVRQLAVLEAESRWRWERANRFGNPVVGPSYSINESKVSFVGASVALPIPALNRNQGAIQQRQAEWNKALLEQHNIDLQIRQEVKAALARLAEVQNLIRLYRDDYLPALETRVEELGKLYRQGGEGVDLQQVLELRRRLLKTRESYLDALYEHGQIEVDLAAAVGDLELAFDPR